MHWWVWTYWYSAAIPVSACAARPGCLGWATNAWPGAGGCHLVACEVMHVRPAVLLCVGWLRGLLACLLVCHLLLRPGRSGMIVAHNPGDRPPAGTARPDLAAKMTACGGRLKWEMTVLD